MKRLLDYDPLRGVSCFFNYDEAKESLTITHEQDVAAILDANKKLANDEEATRLGIKNDWWHYATIPTVIELEWKQKYNINLHDPADKHRIFKLLNHPDYRYLKTTNLVHNVSPD